MRIRPYHYDLCGLPVFFRCEHRIAAPVPALPSPSVLFLHRTNYPRDHRAADRSQARCSTRVPQSSGASPHPKFQRLFSLAFVLVVIWHQVFCFSSTLQTFPKLFIKTLKLANAVFLGLLILLVIPNVQSMELRHLRYFAAVAALGSFSRAANQLHLTQPALSRQVKGLEDEIGVALIVRGQNTISLTSAGEAFYEEAKEDRKSTRLNSSHQIIS